MNVSRKFYLFLFATYLLQSAIMLQSHWTTPIGMPEQITTTENLYATLTSKEPAVIMLKMENCPHCKMLDKHFQAAASNRAYRNINFFYAINGKNQNQLMTTQAVKEVSKGTVSIPGFPSLIYVNKGKIVDHQIGGNQKTLLEKLNNLIKK